MKRDMDLIRQILLRIETEGTDDKRLFLKIEGYSEGEISYHVKLLAEAGLIRAMDMERGVLGSIWWPISLTWNGHDFLDAARDDTNWNKAKSLVGAKVASASFEVFKAVLSELAKSALGLG
jgi:uncharacterized protein DUF2513